jgi:hypothetical protein
VLLRSGDAGGSPRDRADNAAATWERPEFSDCAPTQLLVRFRVFFFCWEEKFLWPRLSQHSLRFDYSARWLADSLASPTTEIHLLIASLS